MSQMPEDIYTEPSPIDADTLRNLGPLRALAGVWQGRRGLDVKPKADGPRQQAYVERMELQPIDPQTNGPQLLYGLRYSTHVTKPEQTKTYHEQVGYWLWEPATGAIIHTLCIPRGVVLMAHGQAGADARQFTVHATHTDTSFGIRSTPFLVHAFDTRAFHIQVTLHDDDSWSYEEDTVLHIRGQSEPFHHTDRNHLRRIADPTPNPLARG